jgi:hypothetical protein
MIAGVIAKSSLELVEVAEAFWYLRNLLLARTKARRPKGKRRLAPWAKRGFDPHQVL